MQFSYFTTWVWISAGLIPPLLGFSDGMVNPSPGETIATFIANSIVDTTDEAASYFGAANNSNETAGRNGTTKLNGRDSLVNGAMPRLYRPSNKDFSVTYNDSGLGYNLTLPGCTPADTVVGDWMSPSGDLIENCTIAQMYQKLILPQAVLSNFTLTGIETLLAKFNNTLQKGVCNPPSAPPDRELLADPARFRYDPKTHTGYWLGQFVTGVGSFSIAFTGLAAGILTRNRGLITDVQECAILAAFGTMATMFAVMAIDARERRRFGRVEALLLNAALAAGENTFSAGNRVRSCVSLATLQNGIQSLTEAVNDRAGVLMIGPPEGTVEMAAAGNAAINLVTQGDIENQIEQCIPQ